MSSEEPQKIKVFYQNSANHQTLFVGGAWAGIAPNGLIQLGLFNDLRPMPEMVTHGVVNDEMGPELEKLEKRGVIREVEATLLIPLPIAISILQLVQQTIDKLVEVQNSQAEKVGEHVSD
jgi:hypothetical protein